MPPDGGKEGLNMKRCIHMQTLLGLRNDKQRTAFLDDYTNAENGWYLWKYDDDLQRRWWRYDLPDCALIVEEDQQTFNWPDTRIDWCARNWFIIRDWSQRFKTFRDQAASRTMALAEIKRVQKEAKA